MYDLDPIAVSQAPWSSTLPLLMTLTLFPVLWSSHSSRRGHFSSSGANLRSLSRSLSFIPLPVIILDADIAVEMMTVNGRRWTHPLTNRHRYFCLCLSFATWSAGCPPGATWGDRAHVVRMSWKKRRNLGSDIVQLLRQPIQEMPSA